MKRSIAILIALAVIITSVMVACKDDDAENSTSNVNEGASAFETDPNDANLNGIEFEVVTDEKGEVVTDKNGETVTKGVQVKYELTKDGKTIAVVVDDKGEPVTNKKGEKVTVHTDVEITTRRTTAPEKTTKKGDKPTVTKSTTMSTNPSDSTTEPELTTKENTDAVPKTSATGKSVVFSAEDQQTLKNMLEVPFLYVANYENTDGVPISAAAHVALWMLNRDGLTTDSYAAGTVAIDLFKYYSQTVVNFKYKVNESGGTDAIIYNQGSDTYTVRRFEAKQQEVAITGIEDLGYGNYYKVTASVTDAGGISKVVAIFQKNKLDTSLNFSIKAIKWS